MVLRHQRNKLFTIQRGPAEPLLVRDGFGFLTQAVAQGIEHRMFQGVNSVISKSSSFLRCAGKAWE